MNRRDALRTLATAAALAPLGAAAAGTTSAGAPASRLPRLRVHAGGHYLQRDDDRPFFWLGDTAWELAHRATREECSYYLRTRARQGFTVIQVNALAEFDGLRQPTPDGLRPFSDLDPARPVEAYFDRVVEIVDEAAAHGLYVALLPAWGDKLTAPWGDGPRIFRLDNLPVARAYARYLGGKLRDRSNVVWMLGGDRPAVLDPTRPDQWPQNQARSSGFAVDTDWRPIWREMAAGLAEGTGATPFCLYHPAGGDRTTSAMLPDEPWLAVHGMQSGHGGGHDVPVWEQVTTDVALVPPKPTLDLEPNYEDHPVSPWPRWDPATGYFRDHDVRKQCWRSVFAGAAGVTYGHHSVWQWACQRHDVINFADRDWRDALHRPAATQVRFLRDLLESRPFFERVPDQGLLTGDAGRGGDHVRATRSRDGHWAAVYFPRAGQRVSLDLSRLHGPRVRAWGYDPRTGLGTLLGERPAAPAEFTSPAVGPDWVLVLDSTAAGFGPPGLPAGVT